MTYLRDETGQHGNLTLMPPEAFVPEPSGPLGLVTREDVLNQNPTKPNADATPARPAGTITDFGGTTGGSSIA